MLAAGEEFSVVVDGQSFGLCWLCSLTRPDMFDGQSLGLCWLCWLTRSVLADDQLNFLNTVCEKAWSEDT